MSIVNFQLSTAKKRAPGIPGTVKNLFAKELADLLLEGVQRLKIAVGMYLQGTGEIKAQHADEAFCVDLLHVIADEHREGLNGCQGNKFFHILKGMKGNLKFLHRVCPPLYKLKSFVYNEGNNAYAYALCKNYSRLKCDFQLAFLEDIHNLDI